MLNELFSLPLNVSCDILGSWLVLKSVVYLDTAFCVCRTRAHLIRTLSAKELVHHSPVVMRDKKMVQWLSNKSLRIGNVVLGAKTERSHKLVQYFASFGDSMHCVHICEKCNETDTMCFVASYCRSLTIIRCTNVSLSLAFHAVLLNNPHIQEIWVQKATCMLPGLMNDLTVHKL